MGVFVCLFIFGVFFCLKLSHLKVGGKKFNSVYVILDIKNILPRMSLEVQWLKTANAEGTASVPMFPGQGAEIPRAARGVQISKSLYQSS